MNKTENEKWRVEYTDGREVCEESWDVTNGTRFFECFDADDANWLCGVLNDYSKPKHERYVEMKRSDYEVKFTKEQLESIMWEPTLQRMRRSK